MKHLAAAIPLLLASCGGIPTPWHSEEEILEVADAAALTRAEEVAEAAAAGGTDMSAYQPTAAYEAPAPSGDGMPDWLTLLLFGVGGGGTLSVARRMLPRDPVPFIADLLTAKPLRDRRKNKAIKAKGKTA